MTSVFPHTKTLFEKRRPNFERWLSHKGASIQVPTNPYEILRFSGLVDQPMGIIWAKASDLLTYNPTAQRAMDAHLGDNPGWRMVEATRELDSKERVNFKLALIERDGLNCFYCNQPVTVETVSIEHFVSRTYHGPNHLANLVLAHRSCNEAVGNLSIREKLEVAIGLRKALENNKELPHG